MKNRIVRPLSVVCGLSVFLVWESLPSAWCESEIVGKPLLSLVTDQMSDGDIVALIDQGADITTEGTGEAPLPILTFAVQGRATVVEALLKRGADANALSLHKLSALMLAAQSGNKETVELLLANHADISLKDPHDRTALFHAANRGRLEIVELLVKAGADPQEKYVGGYTDLMLAAIRGDIPAAEKALAEGGDLNAATTNPPGYTALHVAILNNQQDMLAWLLEKKPELEMKSFNGTPLGLAEAEKRTQLAEMLRAAGAQE